MGFEGFLRIFRYFFRVVRVLGVGVSWRHFQPRAARPESCFESNTTLPKDVTGASQSEIEGYVRQGLSLEAQITSKSSYPPIIPVNLSMLYFAFEVLF